LTTKEDKNDLASFQNLKPLEIQLAKIEEQVIRLKKNFEDMRNKEVAHRNLNGN
jgi:hypothetical protein